MLSVVCVKKMEDLVALIGVNPRKRVCGGCSTDDNDKIGDGEHEQWKTRGQWRAKETGACNKGGRRASMNIVDRSSNEKASKSDCTENDEDISARPNATKNMDYHAKHVVEDERIEEGNFRKA